MEFIDYGKRFELFIEGELWKDIPDYEGLYQISNLGRVKSLKRISFRANGSIANISEKILKQTIGEKGYYRIALTKPGIYKNHSINRLVYETFKGKTNLQVDHIIEGNKLDNRLDNLQALTPRENVHKCKLSKNKTSKYIGVWFNKARGKYTSVILLNGKKFSLGYYKTEFDAHLRYQEVLNNFLYNMVLP